MKQTISIAVLSTAISVFAISMRASAALVGYWNFNEAGGSTAQNKVAGGPDGTLLGSAAFVPGGILGGAIQLNNATNDLVSFGNNYGFTSGSFSVVVWIKLNAGDTSGIAPIAKHIATVGAGYFLAVNDVLDGVSAPVNKAHFWATSFTGASSIVVNDGGWHQLVGVHDIAMNKLLLYVDGQFQNDVGQSTVVGNSAPLLVGGIVVGSTPTNSFTGLVDEVRLYDNALSAGDVQALYQPAPGDFNQDRQLDLVDYLILSLNLHTDVSALTTDQSYALGDMNLDRIIDGRDFVDFRSAYDEVNGAGAFVAMLNRVPEPTSAALAALASGALIARRRLKGRRRDN